jgi:hypothetical protein
LLNNLRQLKEGVANVTANLIQLLDEFVADVNQLRVNSSREAWYQFFRKWSNYLFGLQISGAVIWFYNHPVGGRIINALLNRLYVWISSSTNNSASSITDELLEQVVVEELIMHFTNNGQACIDFLFAYF